MNENIERGLPFTVGCLIGTAYFFFLVGAAGPIGKFIALFVTLWVVGFFLVFGLSWAIGWLLNRIDKGATL